MVQSTRQRRSQELTQGYLLALYLQNKQQSNPLELKHQAVITVDLMNNNLNKSRNIISD
ncbi:hypothetical protein GTQ43_15175 [Nostoc sp. KVJ3]|uniref:hypothetical protein n=1 Tax=Nostoc sp. KVJ3 TaxID=457945 RepID=UPI002237E36D|nr:hypothetical protein [Nostoc sp. KVJ3]MCW5315102.1 hypothetical protein [Nostoc sp. KVJ3]